MTPPSSPRLVCDNTQGEENPFPVHALPPLARGLVRAMTRTIKAPPAICAAALLTVMSLVAQALADIKLPSVGRTPLSLFLLTVAKSGERKSATDKIAMAVIEKFELALVRKFGKDALPRVVTDLTIEGLDSLFEHGAHTLGLFNDEGGQVTNSRHASEENKVAFLTAVCKLWDASPRKRVRKGDGVWWLVGKRLAVHLMMQPILAMELLKDAKWNDQGMLPRFLVCWPASTIGTRTLAECSPADERAKQAFYDRIEELLEMPHPVDPENEGSLTPPGLQLTAGAAQVWKDFYEEIEVQLGDGGPLAHVQAYGCKIAEQAGRVAGVFAVFERGTQAPVTKNQMQRAVEIGRFFLEEISRLKGASAKTQVTQASEQLWRFLANWKDPTISMAEIQQRSPLRKVAVARPAVDKLINDGRLMPIKGGAQRDGRHRKEVFKIVVPQLAVA